MNELRSGCLPYMWLYLPDDTAAKNDIPVIKHHSLSGGECPLRLVKDHLNPSVG